MKCISLFPCLNNMLHIGAYWIRYAPSCSINYIVVFSAHIFLTPADHKHK